MLLEKVIFQNIEKGYYSATDLEVRLNATIEQTPLATNS